MRNQKNGFKYVSKFHKQDVEDADIANEGQTKQTKEVGKEEIRTKGASVDLKQMQMFMTRVSPGKVEKTESNSSPMSTSATKT